MDYLFAYSLSYFSFNSSGFFAFTLSRVQDTFHFSLFTFNLSRFSYV